MQLRCGSAWHDGADKVAWGASCVSSRVCSTLVKDVGGKMLILVIIVIVLIDITVIVVVVMIIIVTICTGFMEFKSLAPFRGV